MSYDPSVRTIRQQSNEPTGFRSRADTALSFNAGTLTLSLTPTGPSFDVFVKGVKYGFDAAQTAVITDTEGLWYFYIDDTGALLTTQTFTTAIITEYAYVAILYWNAVDNTVMYFGDERHGLTMDGSSHLYLHESVGAAYVSGFGLSGFSVDGSGALASHAQFSCGNGVFYDEDIQHDVEDGAPQNLDPTAEIPVFYRSGASGLWRRKDADSYPLIYSGTGGYTGANGRAPYNQFTGGSWQLTEVGQGNLFLVHYFVTNDISTPVIGIQGVQEYTTLKSARIGAMTEIASLSGLPFAEFVPIGSVIFQTSTAYSNVPASRIRTTDGGASYVDFRPNGHLPVATAIDHGSLVGLGDIDHPATAIAVDTTNFDGLLSVADSTVQAALETLDDVVVGVGGNNRSTFDHLLGNMNGTTRHTDHGLLSQYAGTDAFTLSIPGETDHPGIVRLRTGTTTTGWATLYTSHDSSTLFGGSTPFVFETMVYFDAIPDGTEDYEAYIGFHDRVGGSFNWLNGAAFRIMRSINSSNIIASTADNFTFTNVDTGVAFYSGSWKKFRIEVNAAATSVEYFIDDVSVATITTNIPTASGRVSTPAWRIEKLAGTTSRFMHIDYLYLEWA